MKENYSSKTSLKDRLLREEGGKKKTHLVGSVEQKGNNCILQLSHLSNDSKRIKHDQVDRFRKQDGARIGVRRKGNNQNEMGSSGGYRN